uniref:Cancer/testis antigen 83 n=1 Tax=Equus caballus TaxID=9796 RepID=F7CEK6_HORSE
MSVLFLLVSGVLFAFMFVCWKNQLQRNTAEMSSSSTSLALVRLYSSTGSTNRNTEILSVNSLSRDILINFPHSIAMQKQILVNLRTVEYKLELERLLVTRGSNSNWKSTD